jgi:glutaminase
MLGSNTMTADIFSPSIDKKYNSVKATHVPIY